MKEGLYMVGFTMHRTSERKRKPEGRIQGRLKEADGDSRYLANKTVGVLVVLLPRLVLHVGKFEMTNG